MGERQDHAVVFGADANAVIIAVVRALDDSGARLAVGEHGLDVVWPDGRRVVVAIEDAFASGDSPAHVVVHVDDGGLAWNELSEALGCAIYVDGYDSRSIDWESKLFLHKGAVLAEEGIDVEGQRFLHCPLLPLTAEDASVEELVQLRERSDAAVREQVGELGAWLIAARERQLVAGAAPAPVAVGGADDDIPF